MILDSSKSFKIGFGSCYDESQKGAHPDINLLNDVLNEDLDMWVWLGDMAYVDNKSDKRESKSIFDKLRHFTVLQAIPKILMSIILGIE